MFCRWCFQSLFTPPFPRHVRAGIAFDGIYFAAAVQREFVRCGRLLCLPALRLGLRSSLSRICRSCSRRGAAEGDFEASLPAFVVVAQDAGRPKAILKHRFPLLPQLLKAQGGRRRFCSITSRFRRSCSRRGRRGRRRCSPPRRG